MKKFAQQRIAMLLRRLAVQVSRAAKASDVEAVHDLRVSIRRFSRGLRAFRQFLPRGAARKMRGRVRDLMRLAAAVRDRDIALELLAAAGISAGAAVAAALRRERAEASATLLAETRRWTRRNFSRKWRASLEL